MNETKLSFPERLSQIITEQDMDFASFSEAIGKEGKKFHASNITRYIQGLYKPKSDFFNQFKIAFPQYNVEWLEKGTGSKYSNKQSAERISESGTADVLQTTDISSVPYSNKTKKEKPMSVTEYSTELHEAQIRVRVAQEQMDKALSDLQKVLSKKVTLTKKELSTN